MAGNQGRHIAQTDKQADRETKRHISVGFRFSVLCVSSGIAGCFLSSPLVRPRSASRFVCTSPVLVHLNGRHFADLMKEEEAIAAGLEFTCHARKFKVNQGCVTPLPHKKMVNRVVPYIINDCCSFSLYEI